MFPPSASDNRELLRREILKKQLEKTADEWMEMYLQDGNIAAEPYRTSIQAMDHPAVLANGTVVTIHDPRVGPLRTVAPLVDFKDTGRAKRTSPGCGTAQRRSAGTPAAAGRGRKRWLG